MKTLGLLGGMSWESTAVYYRLINREIRRRLGGSHSARCVVYSLDFAEVEALQRAGEWGSAARMLAEGARRLVAAGAELLLICSNTMHRIFDELEREVPARWLHIADATARRIRDSGLRQVGLLGTRFTMEESFYRERLEGRHGLRVLTPEALDRRRVDEVIFRELVLGRIRRESRAEFVRIIEQLAERGAEGVILGCTEIGLLVKPRHTRVPLFDTTEIHAMAAVEAALAAE